MDTIIPGCQICRWSEGRYQGLYCRYWRAYCYKRCNEWEREPGADDEYEEHESEDGGGRIVTGKQKTKPRREDS